MELTKASSRSTLGSYSSECDCYLCQYGTGCQYVDPYPFYPTVGNPLVYFAKTKTEKNREGKKPNAFVRAFRWYTEQPKPQAAPNDPKQDVPILNQENREPCVETCRSVCRESDRMNMTDFARWLDDKYEQFLLENSDGPYVCEPDQSALTQTLDPNTQTQPQSETCQPSCPKKNRFPRLKSPWKKHRERSKSMDKGCPKDCGIRPGERQKGSMEYILCPNNVSRAASVCCYPTPSSCCSVLVKSQSMTSCNKDSAYNQEVEIRKPVVLDNPPVEQKLANSYDGNVTKESKMVEKKAITTNISCQCYLNAISNDAQTQYETIKASSEPSGPNTPFSSASNAPDALPPKKKGKHWPHKKKTKGDSSKKNLDSSNISTTSTQTKSNVTSPYSAGLCQDAYSQYEQPEDRLLDQCPFYNAPCPSFQKPIPNQREPCSSLQEPCSGRRPCPTLQPKDRSFDPCPFYNAPYPSFQKLISNQREPYPSLQEPCPGRRPCPTLQPEDRPFDLCPSNNAPCPSFQEPISNQREPCPSLQEPCPGRRPCPTLQEPCPGRRPCPTLQPEDRPFDPYPSYNAPYPSFQKPIPNQREPCPSLQEPYPGRRPCSTLQEPCPGRRPCPTLQPEDRPFEPSPSHNAPCSSFPKLIPDQREPCPSRREPCPGRRPCPTLHGRCPKYNEINDSCRESDLHLSKHGSHLRNSKYDDSHEITKTGREINRNVCGGPCRREDCSDHCRANPKIDASTIRQKPTLNESELTPNVCKPRSNHTEECSKFNETKYKSEITTTCREGDFCVNDSCPSPHRKCSDNYTISNRDTNSICRGPISKVGEPNDSCRESDLHVSNHGSHQRNSKYDDSHEITKTGREINRNVYGSCRREDCSDHSRANPKIDASTIRQKPTLNESELTPNVCEPRSNHIEECSKFNETNYKSEITTTCHEGDFCVNDSCPSPHKKCSDNYTISNRDTNSICRGPISKVGEPNDSCRESDLHVSNHGSHLRNSKYDDSHEITKTGREINRNVCGSPCRREDCSDHSRANPKIDASTIRQKPTLNESELTPNVCKPRSNHIEECSKFIETKYKSEITTTCRERDSCVNDSCPSPQKKCSDNYTISNRDTNSICRGPIPKVGEPRPNKCMRRSTVDELSPNVCKPCPGPRKEFFKFNETTSKPKLSPTPAPAGSYLYNACPSLREEGSEARPQPGPIISEDNSNVCKPCPSIRKECSNHKETSPNGDVNIKEPVFCESSSISKQATNHQATCPTLFENNTGLQTCTGLSKPNKNQQEYRRKSETNNIPIQSNRETVPNSPMESSCKPSFSMREPSSSNCEPTSSIPEPSFNFRDPTCYREAVPNCSGPTPNLGQAYPSCCNARFNCYYVREACPGFHEICATQVQCPGRFEPCLGCCCPNCGVFHESNINDKPNEAQPQRYYYPHPYNKSPQQNIVITMPAPPVVAEQEPVGKCSADCPYYKSKIEAEQTTTNNQATEAVSEQVTVDTVQTSNDCIRLDTINKYPFFMKIVCADRLLNEKISK